LKGIDLKEKGGSMERVTVATKARTVGAYSQAIKVKGGTTIYTSGKGPFDHEGKLVGKGDHDVQFQQALDCLEEVLNASGATFDDVVKTTIYTTDIDKTLKSFHIYAKRFKGDYPASTLVEVSKLAVEGMMIEIEAIAVIE